MGDFVKVKDKSEYDAVLNESDVRTDIKVGGKDENTGGKFTPNINMQKWDGECWLNINHPDIVSGQKPDFTPKQIQIELNNKIHRYRILDDSRIEYEIDFLKKPASPVIRLNLDFPNGLQFFLQPELTQLEKDQEISRPENVIDSYAVYWKKRNNKYKTGKFCHIYRIRATDSYGIWTWCKQQVVGKEWIITIPINFWQNAVYPIVIDPMIGWSGGGASCLPAKDRLNGTVYTAPAETGNITKWHFSICQVDETDKRMKAGIAETDENGNPSYQNVVEQIEMDPIEVSSDFQWDGQGGEIVGEEEYYLTFDCPNSNNRLTLDGGGNKYWYKAVIPYDTAIPDPLPEIYQSQQYQVGIWVDYEVPPAPEISFTPSSFNFEANEGEGNPSNQILEIWNSGAGTLNWNVDDDADWLVENPKSGESTGEYDEVTVSVDITGLEAGVYNATITITAPGASNTPQTIPVQLTINPAAEFIEVIEGDSIITKQIDGDSTITKIIDEKSAITKLIDEESPLNG